MADLYYSINYIRDIGARVNSWDELQAALDFREPPCTCDFSRGRFSCTCVHAAWAKLQRKREQREKTLLEEVWHCRSQSRLNDLRVEGTFLGIIKEGESYMPPDADKWKGTKEGERHPRYPILVWKKTPANWYDPLAGSTWGWEPYPDEP